MSLFMTFCPIIFSRDLKICGQFILNLSFHGLTKRIVVLGLQFRRCWSINLTYHCHTAMIFNSTYCTVCINLFGLNLHLKWNSVIHAVTQHDQFCVNAWYYKYCFFFMLINVCFLFGKMKRGSDKLQDSGAINAKERLCAGSVVLSDV